MKNFTVPSLFTGLFVVCIWGCQPAWWHIDPTEIYSPVDFSKPYKVRVDDYVTVEFKTNLKNRIEDTLGVYLYDNLSSLRLQLTKNEGDTKSDVIGRAPYMNEWAKAGIVDEIGKVKVFRSPKNNELYLLPVLRSYKTNATFRNYFSTSYLKVQLNPWSKLATLTSTETFTPCLFTDNSSLFYVGNLGESLYLYRLDPTTNRFNTVGVSSDLNISKFGDTNEKIIKSVDYGFYDKEKKQYHLFVRTSGAKTQSVNSLGELVLDSDFNVVDYQLWAIGGTYLNFNKIYRQNDTLHVLYTYQKRSPGESSNLYTLTRSGISLKTGKTLFTYDINKTSQPYLNPFSTVAFVGTDLLIKYERDTTFSYIGLTKPERKIRFPAGVDADFGSFHAVENGANAYILAGLYKAGVDHRASTIKLYGVKMDSQNGVVFENSGLNSLPAGGQFPEQGLLYQDNLMLLNGVREVWQLNPKRTKIDSLAPHTEVIPTNR